MSDDAEFDAWLAKRRQVLAFRAQRHAHPAVPEPPKGRTHGRIATYNKGCRCASCTSVASAKVRAYRQRKKATT
jgi:hypothetical protein